MGEPHILLRNVASQQVWGLTFPPHRQELKLRAQSARTAPCSLGGGETGLEPRGRGGDLRREDWTSPVFFTRFSLIKCQVANMTK